ncbi:MAG: MATE family efflux transporter, partial [Oscillospiraceae bacterium]
MVNDMTKGNPTKLIISFTIPLLIGNIFQQFYNMVDMMVVGRFLGSNALAAVGSTGSLSFLVIGFVTGITGGFSVLVAQRFGANDEKGVRHATAMAVILSIVSTIVLTVASVLTTDFFLKLMNTTPDIYKDAHDYIIIIFAGVGASIFYNLISGILRALGDSKTPLYFLIVASILNIILDIVLIKYFAMGVSGAAVATVISQVVSGLLCLIYMAKRYTILRFQKGDWKLDLPLCKKHLQIGIPMAIQFSIIAIGAIILQGAINPMGADVVAAYTAGNKVEQLCTQPLASMGVTMATFCAQNLGAGNIDRIKLGMRKALIISMIFTVCGSAALLMFGRNIASIFFVDASENILNLAQTYLT